MDKFIVSARKYRPQDFSTVVGQSHITTTLKNAIRNKQLAHAFLFCGPRGVGKTTCARILAKTINCENITPDGEACNRCSSCVSFNDGASLNIHELDAASNNSVDDIRTLVEQVRFAPQAGKYKVYIIDEVHMLSTSAFNAFLKTLEEPPPYAIFILATTEKHKILPTILSRCQIFDFKRITPADTVEHLQDICTKEEITADKTALQVIAQKSEGCMRDALSILDKIVSFTNGELTYSNTLEHLNILDADYYFRILDAMQQQDLSEALLVYDSINRKGFEGDLVLNGLAEFIRNLLVCKDEKVAMLLEVVESFRDRYIAAGRGADAGYLVSALNVLNEAEINYKSARNKRLHVELALIKLCYLAQALQVVDGGKKKPETVRAVSFRNIPAMELVVPRGGAKLMVETGIAEPQAAPVKEPVREPEPAAAKKAIPGTGAASGAASAAPSLGALSKIRQQFSSKQGGDGAVSIRPLEPEALQKAWQQYADQLRENRNPAVQSLELATLRIVDGNSFEVITNNPLEQKFVEHEKRTLSEHLQNVFSNKMISFTVVVVEREDTEEGPADRPLNKREQFIQIVEQYPLVKELKDRLKLELDY
ncbi:MAG TPA: DNA polymerase III subunit gamma/tau [Puia sp.]|uniref:DNA polymerase III subunit gamma/tau n=1 Tax=Puia sp. TaxID=2045100 RepID=UPI002C5CFFA6|nr:DNA polymerase III subunit gamma/tau [Puia sp.]HVU99244.1 DNA polymerase III subunit gamma/tau [Puia sp.]